MDPSALIARNVAAVRGRIAAAAKRAGRSPDDVTLVAVTKAAPVSAFAPLAAAGVRDFGENRALEAIDRARHAPAGLRWHLIGHLQTNKVRKALGLFRIIHSLDSLRLANEIQKEASSRGGAVEAFVEVNSGEAQKSGIAAAELPGFLAALRGMTAIRVAGLMTMAPLSGNPESSRPHFRRLRELRDASRADGPSLAGLSMGMSQDFEVAVEEGATHVRVGTALFEGLETGGA